MPLPQGRKVELLSITDPVRSPAPLVLCTVLTVVYRCMTNTPHCSFLLNFLLVLTQLGNSSQTSALLPLKRVFDGMW